MSSGEFFITTDGKIGLGPDGQFDMFREVSEGCIEPCFCVCDCPVVECCDPMYEESYSDDFSGGTLDGSWTFTGAGSYSMASGAIRDTSTGSQTIVFSRLGSVCEDDVTTIFCEVEIDFYTSGNTIAGMSCSFGGIQIIRTIDGISWIASVLGLSPTGGSESTGPWVCRVEYTKTGATTGTVVCSINGSAVRTETGVSFSTFDFCQVQPQFQTYTDIGSSVGIAQFDDFSWGQT